MDNVNYFTVWLRNRLKSAGLEPILSHTEKSCIVSYYKQFSTNIKIKLIQVFSPGLRPLVNNKTGYEPIIFILISAESLLNFKIPPLSSLYLKNQNHQNIIGIL